eukprot:5856388-Pleurochrysis_carterae.AAC.1
MDNCQTTLFVWGLSDEVDPFGGRRDGLEPQVPSCSPLSHDDPSHLFSYAVRPFRCIKIHGVPKSRLARNAYDVDPFFITTKAQ